MAISTSSKPEEGGKIDVDFEKQISKRIEESRAEVENVSEAYSKYNKERVSVMKSVGGRINALAQSQADGKKAKKYIVQQFHTALGLSKAQLYKFSVADEYFSTDQIKKIQEAGVTVRTFEALLSVHNQKQREELLKGVLSGAITDSEIRANKGTNGSRKEAGTQKAVEAARKMPPMRVFRKAQDKVGTLSDQMLAASEAAERMDASGENAEGEVGELVNLRAMLKSVKEEVDAFLKHTSSYEKKVGK